MTVTPSTYSPLTDNYEVYQQAVTEFERLHPHYCRTCQGWGVVGGPTDRATGIADADPCRDCENACPHCGTSMLDAGDPSGCTLAEFCSECGYSYGDEGMPSPPFHLEG